MLALFDLDHTLISNDSDYLWGKFLIDQKLVDPVEFQKKNDYFFEQYNQGCLDIYEYQAFVAKGMSQFSAQELQDKLQQLFYENEAVKSQLAGIEKAVLNGEISSFKGADELLKMMNDE